MCYRVVPRSPRQPTPHPDYYNPCTFNDAYTDDDMDRDLVGLLSDTDAVILQALPTPNLSCPSPLTIPELAHMYKDMAPTQPFTSFISDNVTDQDRDDIQRLTVKQRKCRMWHEQHRGCITASMMHKVTHYRGNEPDNYVVKTNMGESTFEGSGATQYGIENEPLAKKLCKKCMSDEKHRGVKVSDSGLHVSVETPLLKTSPDGIVCCKCCGTGMLEVKCTYKHRNLSVDEIAQKNDYHVCFGENGQISLKQSSSWYSQIQAQLGITGHKWCDFVIFTQKSPCIFKQHIQFDVKVWEMMLAKSLEFYEKFVVPKLLS